MITKKIANDKKQAIGETLKIVFDALNAKGYDPIEQIWGYLLSEDPHYITTYNDARKIIAEIDREDIGRCLLEIYFNV